MFGQDLILGMILVVALIAFVIQSFRLISQMWVITNLIGFRAMEELDYEEKERSDELHDQLIRSALWLVPWAAIVLIGGLMA